MKAVMYHYIREHVASLPNFTYLRVADFREQLAHFKKSFGFAGRDEFLSRLGVGGRQLPDTPRVVLTFDDGLREHFDVVAPILADLSLWAIFYVPTGPLQGDSVLDVHRSHLLLGRLGGHEALRILLRRLPSGDDTLQRAALYREITYTRQTSATEAAKNFKRLVNYVLADDRRRQILDELVNETWSTEEWTDLAASLYMTPQMLRELESSGHLIGSHSKSHRVLSRLPKSEQEAEIRESFGFLAAEGLCKIRTFCYPYGGFHTFDSTTQQLLASNGVDFAFNVEQRDITSEDLSTQALALPRFDCNQFPFGRAQTGHSRQS